MKTLAVSLVLALGLGAPAFAQAPDKPAPVPAADSQPPIISDVQYPDITPPAADVLPEATTPEARKIQLLRCSGPPPLKRKVEVADTLKAFSEEQQKLEAKRPG